MPRRQFNDGQEIIQGDLGSISSSLEIELYDRYLYEHRGRQQNVFMGDSMVASYINATTSQVKAGSGNYYDNTQVDPEPMTRLLYLAANQNVTHTAANGSNNRIDLICIAPGRATTSTQIRNFKDAGTGAISSQSMVVETDWSPTLQVVAGTPSGSPAVPATPAGYLAIAQVLVTAVTGIAGAGAYTDVRSRYQFGSTWKKVSTITAAYTVDLDDGCLICNATGAPFTVTLPAASKCVGKEIEIFKNDASANAVTVAGAGGDLIIGSATQLLSTQYTSLTLRCDGTTWYLK